MCSVRKLRLVVILLLVKGSVTSTKSIERTEIETVGNGSNGEKDGLVEVTYEEIVTTEYPLQNVTTKTPFRVIEIFATPATLENVKLLNISSDFKPSIHLGEIGQARVSTNTFNTVHHLQFENSINPNYGDQLHNVAVSPQQSVHTFAHNTDHHLDNISRQVDAQKHVQTSPIKFEDGTSYILENSAIRFEDGSKYNSLRVKPVHENLAPHYEVVEQQQVFQNLENPIYTHETILEKPVNYQTISQNYDVATTTNLDGLSSSHQGVHDYNHYQPALQDYQVVNKPDNNMLYVHQQESSFTRTRKYPYSFHQGPIGYHGFTFFEDHKLSPYFRRRRVSPWKKLVHLIGAFLPLGLLVAALTPNVVKIDNTTQPNIVLSKLRAADLPMEHKNARLLNERQKECEDRSVCEMILAGGQAGSNLMQNVLWSIAVRTSKKAAKDNDLEDIFEAAMKKDCSIIIC